MLKLHTFYREYEKLPNEDKFSLIDAPQEPTSLFVIFKRLTEVRAQKKFFEEQEEHLLKLAELGFNNKKNKDAK